MCNTLKGSFVSEIMISAPRPLIAQKLPTVQNSFNPQNAELD